MKNLFNKRIFSSIFLKFDEMPKMRTIELKMRVTSKEGDSWHQTLGSRIIQDHEISKWIEVSGTVNFHEWFKSTVKI